MEASSHDPSRLPSRGARLLLTVNLVGLALVAVWFRCCRLENVPGINGDEAWYGVKTVWLLWGHDFRLQTPTGNPPNPFFFGPVLLLHLCFGPSTVLLRSVAVGSGLAALAVNWWLCRWVFDRRTGIVSTLVLAILPITIAYSRLAWDASQSLLATLPVLYLSLAAVRHPQRARRLLAAAVAVLVAAVLVHPTNILAGAAIAAALATRLRGRDLKRMASSGLIGRRLAVGLIAGAAVLLVLAVLWLNTPGASRFVSRMGGVRELADPESSGRWTTLFPRLITGGTVYRYVSGSRSWFEWPCPPDSDGWGVDVAVFWGAMAVAIGFLWWSWKTKGRLEDRVLVAAWALELVAFLLIAGPRAMAPHFERYAICLIGPTVVLLGRGLALCLETLGRKRRLVLVAASLAGWLVLADFQVHYFDFIRRTGGRSHRTFRTASIEPKQAVLDGILRQRGTGTAWIVTSDYWIEWPMRYLAMAEKGLRVVNRSEVEASAEYERALREGRVWFVEFYDTDELRQVRAELAGRDVHRWQVEDYGGRPLLCVVHAAAEANGGQ